MATISPLVLIHICGAVIALLAGGLAMMLRKGSSWHAAAGTLFFGSMLFMTTSGFYIAAFVRPDKLNQMMSILTLYLVATAWVAARRRTGKPGIFDWVALLVVFADGATGWTWGIEAAGRSSATAPVYFVFGSIALLCGVADLRMIRRGGITGPRRIVRHLWRMCVALLIALLSFYPGQARLFPAEVRATNLLFVPSVLVLGVMLLWIVRLLQTNRKRAAALATAHA